MVGKFLSSLLFTYYVVGRYIISKINAIFHCRGPKGGVSCICSPVGGMGKSGPCTGGRITNVVLFFPILMIGVKNTEGDILL